MTMQASEQTLVIDGSRCEAAAGRTGLTMRRKMAATLSSVFGLSTGFQRISVVLLWFLLLVAADAQNRKVEVKALLKFKNLTRVDGWVNDNGYWDTWKETDNNTCSWAGVTCTKNLTVERLSFGSWSLTRLPSLGMLSFLPDLRSLDFSFNAFHSVSIPDDIGSLVGLTDLDFSFSGVTGTIPRNLSACQALKYIACNQNTLSGEIPDLSNLVNLKYLIVSQNQLNGSFPASIGKLHNPLKIDLSNNMFTGIIPSLSNLTNLLELVLNNNAFTGFERGFFPETPKLEHLTVGVNQLEGLIPPHVENLKNLHIIDMSGNQLSGPIPPGFSLNMTAAAWINLSDNKLTGTIPESMLQPTPSMDTLPGLALARNFLTGPLPFDKTKQYNYYTLDFSHNHLSGSIPSFCNNEVPSSNSAVGKFYLQSNNFSGNIVDFLADCYPLMKDIQLANNSFTGDLMRIANITATSDFMVKLTNDRFNQVKRVLDISNNDLRLTATEVDPDPLGAVLEFFVLNSSILELRMQGNNLSGTPFPSSFPPLADALQVLDLSSNQLHGEISGAAFNGSWLPALQTLSLSSNYLVGPVPDALVLLPNLTVLNLSYNMLSGPLPAVLPDGLYNPSFYTGNDGLCGGPLTACRTWRGVPWWVAYTVYKYGGIILTHCIDASKDLFLVIVGAFLILAAVSFLLALWRWRVYHKRHQQDADLIKMLRQRESAALMSLRDLKKATDNFADSAQIAEGGFGIVYTGNLSDGTMVAIKRSKREGSEKQKEEFLNEVRILSQVNHRHLVKLLGCCLENKVALIVFEFVSNGTLQEHLQRKIGTAPLTWKQRLQIAVQTADALYYLHSAAMYPIYHRDVKSANILLTPELKAKVADFGISRLSSVEHTHVSTLAIQGTIGYLDPEYYTSYRLTDKSDVYSFGVVLLELISAKPALLYGRAGEDRGEDASLVIFAKRHIESGCLQGLIDTAIVETYNDFAGGRRESIMNVGRLAMKCLQPRSNLRPGMSEVLKELKYLCLLLDGSSDELSSLLSMATMSGMALVGEDESPVTTADENDFEDGPRTDDQGLLPDCFLSSNTFSSISFNDASTASEMSQLQQLPRERTNSL